MAPATKKIPLRWNVLIAEDDLNSRAQLLKALNHAAKCVVVDNGKQAIETYRKAIKKKSRFDFVLLDVSMPGPDGFEVLRAIRAEEEKNSAASLKPTRIIMVTSYRDSLMSMYNMGWDEYITKPVETDKLVLKMKTMAGFDSLKS